MKAKKIILLTLLIGLSLLVFSGCKTKTPTGNVAKETSSVDVVFYVMSQCPFGTQVEDAFKPVLDKFKDAIKFRLEFIGLKQGDEFKSLHGESEVKGDKVQLCAQKYEPERFMEMVTCMNENAKDIPDNWEDCAKDMDKEKIKACYEGEEGNKLLEESFAKAQKAKAQGSPTMYFGGEVYHGQRDEDGFTRAICRKIDSPLCEGVPQCKTDLECPITEGKIPVCENAGTADAKCTQKEDAKVVMTILSSKNCADCDIPGIGKQLKQIMPNLETKEVYIEDEEGKNLVEKYKVDKVPVVVFSKTIKDTFIWQKQGDKMMKSFDEFDDGLMIKPKMTNAHYFVDDEKRKEFFEEMGIKTGDNRPQIDFFLMAYCPFGNVAEEAIEPVYELLKDKADFNPHYVIYSNYGGEDFCFDKEQKYCSMHGKQELHQDIRELCVAKKIGVKEYFDFALAMNKKCDYKNADSCWEDVAKEVGLDTAKIKKCYDEEAETLLKKEAELNTLYSVQGSPQVFIDGVQYNGPRTSNSYKEALCKAFENAPKECDTKLETNSGNAPAGSCS